jgi:hypothetical protein
MSDNPISDVIAFFLQPSWTTVVFRLLVLSGIAIAAMSIAQCLANARSSMSATGFFAF